VANILVVEDDAHVLRLVTMWLSRGHKVLEARNGQEAKAHLEHNHVDFIVSDINMPGCDGIELLEWARTERGIDVPAIMLSARCDQVRLGGRLARLRAVVHPKPFSPARLSQEINERLAESAPIAPDCE
jgi:CheY-like chemotaxis protein